MASRKISIPVILNRLCEEFPFLSYEKDLEMFTKEQEGEQEYLVFFFGSRQVIKKKEKYNTIPKILKRLCEEYPDLSYKVARAMFVKEKKSIVEEEKKETKKAKKDSMAPKRAKNAYMFYLAETRNAVKEELEEEGSVTNVTTLVSMRWKELNEEDKAKYLAMAEADKKRYAEEMLTYKEKSTDLEM